MADRNPRPPSSHAGNTQPPSPAESGRLYDELYRASPFRDHDTFYQWVLKETRLAKDHRILDIGCGLGGALRAAPESPAPRSQRVGMDVSREALRGARRETPAASWILGDGGALPFADESFEVVLNLGNLEHFTNLEAGIEEMRRVLTPQGRAWVLLPNLYYSGALWRVIRTGYGPDHHQPIDRFATRSEWRDLLEAGGLRVVRIVPYHKGKWWKRLLPSNLAWHFLYETTKGERAGTPALSPLGRVR